MDIDKQLDEILWLQFTDFRMTLTHDKRPFGQIRADQIRKAKAKLTALITKRELAIDRAARVDELKRTIQLGYGYNDDYEKYAKDRIAELTKGGDE